MDTEEAKRKKRNQVLLTLIFIIFLFLFSAFILVQAPGENTWELLEYLLTSPGSGWGSPLGTVIILTFVFTLLFIIELKEYLRGNYKLWKTSKK